MRRKSKAFLAFPRPPFNWRLGDAQVSLGSETKLMGVLNITPDSFSDGGLYRDPALAERRALAMEEEGAHFIDVGGESSRPGSRPVSAREEIRRVQPVFKRLSRKIKVPLSVDTCKYEVAWACLDEGAKVINDIYGLRGHKRLAKLVARYKAGIVLMHMRGTPLTMQARAVYKDLLRDIRDDLKRSVGLALDAGIPQANIVIDPGFGFGKTAQQNLEILGRLDFFSSLKQPILAGLSRKSFIGYVLGTPVSERLYGSLAAAAAAIFRGAHILRVHDVLAHKQLAVLLDRSLAVDERRN
ncbi:MAG: dihydropteroate synthase [Candidatus Omnitrophica bacterium]|nr:dihydropteroate synthase [Candidatus Omnitrophota bacterium]